MTRKTLGLAALPSTALRQALADLQISLQQPNVAPNMGIWIKYEDGDTGPESQCSVCLAGAMLLQRGTTQDYDEAADSLGDPCTARSAIPIEYFPLHLATRSKLRGINYFRDCDIRAGLCDFYPRKETYDHNLEYTKFGREIEDLHNEWSESSEGVAMRNDADVMAFTSDLDRGETLEQFSLHINNLADFLEANNF